jgi:hypothetical protein
MAVATGNEHERYLETKGVLVSTGGKPPNPFRL